MVAKASIGGVVAKRDQTSPVPKGEIAQQLVMRQSMSEGAWEESGLLTRNLGRRR